MKLPLSACLLLVWLPALAYAQDNASAAKAKPAAVPVSSTRAPAAETPLPAWDQLSAEQREALIAPVRERWDASPQDRARMLDHARRWKSMPPEERERARRGMRRFEHMSPEQRDQARAIFDQTRSMTPEQRKAFREQWSKMSPQERRDWLQRHAPAQPTTLLPAR